ncbi:MAG: hypothetical protein WKF50_00515 [Nocardioides sp.]
MEREAETIGGRTSRGPEHGLLPSFAALAGSRFDPADVDPRIADFYERTSAWRLDFWSEWSPAAWPFGRAIAAMWSQRLQQLSLPMRPLDVSFGMDSEVVHLHDAVGEVVGAAWQRTMRKTGATVYSGLYGTTTLPGSSQPSVRAVFPLPRGSLAVFLSSSADENGGFVPIAEHFHLYVDEDGDVRTDHSLRLWNIPAVRLHYRMRPSVGRGTGLTAQLLVASS